MLVSDNQPVRSGGTVNSGLQRRGKKDDKKFGSVEYILYICHIVKKRGINPKQQNYEFQRNNRLGLGKVRRNVR